MDLCCQDLGLCYDTFEGCVRACVWVGKGLLVEGAYVGDVPG